MSNGEIIVGIDLGTTNSAVAACIDGRPQLIAVDGDPLLPSVVGLSDDGTLLVGHAARNQYAVYPERTVLSVKREMGASTVLRLGDRLYRPQEISAIILRRLKSAAESHLGTKIKRAVITVPAYFSDAQRSATKEAGEIAGFEVARIINEPTAAALLYVNQECADHTFMVYDLGGGTFDVSIVHIAGQVMEVLSSHGDTKLGGDDMDKILMEHLKGDVEAKGVGLSNDLRALARLSRAAEEAKIKLSTESYVRVTEEHIAKREGQGIHLDREVSRLEYQSLIEHLIERTRDSVHIHRTSYRAYQG